MRYPVVRYYRPSDGDKQGVRYQTLERMVIHAATMVALGWQITSMHGVEKHQHCDCCDGECGM
jgi:hypothetical protein